MTTLKRLHEDHKSMMDNDFIGGELAKHDINSSFKNSDGMTHVVVDKKHEQKASKIIKNLGYDSSHKVAVSEAKIHGSWKLGGIAGRTTNKSVEKDGVDHQAEIDRIQNAMKKFPSKDPNIEKQQLDKIAYHKKMLGQGS